MDGKAFDANSRSHGEVEGLILVDWNMRLK